MNKRHFSALMLQLSAACIVACFVFLTMQESEPENYFYPLIFIPYALVIYIINIAFLRRDRTMRDLAILNGLMGIALFVSIAIFGSYESWAALLFAAMFCIYLTMRGAQSAMAEPGLRTVMLCMELSLITLVLFTAWCGYFSVDIIWCLPAITASASGILGVMLMRLERSPGVRGWLLVGLAFLLIFALLWVLVSFAAAPAGEGLVTLWNTLVNTVKFILGLIWRFLLFLISLIPQTEYEEVPMEPPAFDLPEYEEFTESQINLMGALALIAVIVGIFLLVRLLIYLGKFKVGGKKISAVAAPARRRVSFMKGLGRLLGAVWAGICLRMAIWRNRNMPRGLLCILIRKCRTGPWHKTPGETPREFLSRLRHASRHDEKLRDALDGLIPMVDRAIYSPGGEEEPVPGAALIRRRIGRAVRGQFVRRIKKRIRLKLTGKQAA